MRLILCLMSLFLFSCSEVEIVNNGLTPFKISPTKESEIEIETEGELPFYFWANSPTKHELDISKKYEGVAYNTPTFLKVEIIPSFISRFLTISTLGLYNPVPFKIKSYSKMVTR